MATEVRLLIRGLIRSPAYAVIAAGTLGLAIGLNTAIFSLASLFIFEQFPMKDTARLAYIRARNPQQGLSFLGISAADYVQYRDQTTAFEELAATDRTQGYVLDAAGEPLRIRGYGVSANLLSIWGIEPALGRDFAPGEDLPAAPPVAILGHGFWKRQFAASPGIVGSTIRLNGAETTIIGVMDPEVEHGYYAIVDVWTPLVIDPDDQVPKLLPEGRLKQSRSLADARAEVEQIAADIKRRHPASHAGLEVTVLGWDETLSSPDTFLVMFLLLVAVGCVMLIACANVATLMLARASVRARESVLRIALGASRRRIALLVFGEAALLAVTAIGLGLILTSWMHGLLMWVSGDDGAFTGMLRSAEIDWRVGLLTLAVGVTAPLLMALLPAVYTLRLDLQATLNTTGRSAVAGGGLTLRRTMVVVQVSLALALMASAAVLMRTIIDLRDTDLGFAADNTLVLRIDLPDEVYSQDSQIAGFFDEVGERVRALPGVQAAAWTTSRPLWPAGMRRNFSIQGHDHPPDQLPWAATQAVDPDFHRVLEIPVLQGRSLDATDSNSAAPVAVVSRRLAQLYWPETSPVGAGILIDGGEPDQIPIEIVGVVADIYSGDSRNPATPILYRPRAQDPQPGMDLVVRSLSDDPLGLAPAIRRQIWQVDPELPIDRLVTVRQLQRQLLSGIGVLGTLLGIFAGFSLVMAAAGIYGVTAFSVGQRTREIGLRMALGAESGDVRRMVVGQMLKLIAIGVVLGLGGAVLLNRLLQAGLGEARSAEPVIYLIVAALLVFTALVAAYRPVRSATRVDPIEALRVE